MSYPYQKNFPEMLDFENFTFFIKFFPAEQFVRKFVNNFVKKICQKNLSKNLSKNKFTVKVTSRNLKEQKKTEKSEIPSKIVGELSRFLEALLVRQAECEIKITYLI